MNGRFKIRPNPPQAGRQATVAYVGPAKEVEWQVDGGSPTKVRPDANGEFQIMVPRGHALILSDNRGLAGYLYVDIIDTVRK